MKHSMNRRSWKQLASESRLSKPHRDRFHPGFRIVFDDLLNELMYSAGLVVAQPGCEHKGGQDSLVSFGTHPAIPYNELMN